jgi:hypothetical protein
MHVNGTIRFESLAASTQTQALMIDANGDLSKRLLNIDNWNTSYSWGNHAGIYRLATWVPTWTDVTGKPIFANVATSGSYDDLTNQPILFDGNYNSLLNLPSLFDWQYSSLTGIPSFAVVATTGNYNDLNNLPTLFNGNWSNLTGTPPTISTFNNDAGFITSPNDADYNPTNELQNLSVSNSQLLISEGTGVSLDAVNYWSKLGNNLFYNTGRVGIGINDPQKSLHIHSEATNPSGGTGPVIGGTSTQIPIKGIQPVDLTSESTLLLTNKNSGRASTDGLLIRSYDNNAVINLQEVGSLSFITKNALRFKMEQNGKVSIGSINTNYFTVNEIGNVGIGTDNPEQSLHIKGNKMLIEQNGNKLFFDADNNGVEIGSTTNQITFWYSGNYNRIIAGDIISKGKVGIGTDNPQYELDVRGTGHFCEVRVKTNDWCDYVFADDYRLPNLAELELFIKQNKRLPGIPTEAEVIETGIDLGEMNKKLLEKIEELTLIIIEQNKSIEAQGERIKNLEVTNTKN